MSTHGHILIKTSNQEHINVYAYHDGHTLDALKMLMSLPFIVFDKQKTDSLNNCQDGMWVYQQYVHDYQKRTKEALKNSYMAGIPLQTGSLGIANWIVWQKFNHWMVVPNKKWVTYGGHPIMVQVYDDARFVTYAIKGKDYFKDGLKEVLEHTESLNKRLEEPLIQWEDGDLVIPFDRIFIDLMWQDIAANLAKPAAAVAAT